MRGPLLSLLCVVALMGCGLVPPSAPPAPAKVNPFDTVAAELRPAVAQVYLEASRQDFKTEAEEHAFLGKRWAEMDDRLWAKIKGADARYLGNGQWTPGRAKAFRRKLALLADPDAEKRAAPVDDFSFDDDGL